MEFYIRDEVWGEFLALVAAGGMDTTSCRELKIDPGQVRSDRRRSEERENAYIEARAAREDALLEELVTIADTCTADMAEVQLAKLRMYGREKNLIMSNPKRFGTKAEVNIKSAVPLVVSETVFAALTAPAIEAEFEDVE